MTEYWQYNRGSEWRKWDLHIHTPKTKLSDNYVQVGDEDIWKTYCTKIEESDVEVLGITDYFSVENYFTFIEKHKQYFPLSKKVFFPNVELRLEVSVNKSAEEVNIHVIFSNSETITKNKIEDFLLKLDTNIKVHDAIIPCKNLSTKNDFEKAGVKHDIIRTKLKEVFGKDECYLILSAANNAGLRPDTSSPRKLNVTDEIDKVCDGFFGGEQNVDYYLDTERYETEEKAKPKPVLSCCDAHSFEDIDNYLGKKIVKKNDKTGKDETIKNITWIKADPTFEGLKQILYEPRDRVKIQTLRPDTKNSRHVISEIQFKSSDKLFGNQKILLNENLNAIIGGKSSGKSLLLHSIAESIDPEQVKRINTRLNFKGYSFENEHYDFEVTWKNDEKDILSNFYPENKTRKITYIPQLYINYLAEKNNKKELNTLVGNILLQDEVYKTYFEEKKIEIDKISQKTEFELTNLLAIRANAIELNKQIKEVGASKVIAEAIKKIELQITEGQKLSNLSPEDISKYNELIKKKEQSDKELQLILTKINVLQKFSEELLASKNELVGISHQEDYLSQKGKLDKILDVFTEIPEDLSNIKLLISKDFDVIITNLQSEKSKLKLDEFKTNVDKVLKQLNVELLPFLKKLEGQKELKKISEQLDKEKLKKEKSELFEKQLNSAVEEYRNSKKRIANLLKERHILYLDIVSKINETKKEIGEEITLNCSLFYEKEKLSLYEQVNKAAISKDHFFNKLFTENLVNYDLIPDLFHDIINVQDDNSLKLSNDETIPLKQKTTIDEIFRGIIKDNFELDYKVTYQNDELLSMSPGKKGTVLLILFLQINSAEYPILIDQPEDNLDNRTIYDLLCKMVKEKKIERQIIIVSHNANLVVATDSENIIVANQEGQDPEKKKSEYRFEYVNGALEFSSLKNEKIKGVLYQQGIKEHVCDILEGGNEAFKQRERKYAIK